VQRFGAQPTDTLTLQAAPGDRLTLQFTQQNQPQTLTTNSVKLEIQMQPLSEPMLQERVVLSTHRSFESAEDSAQRWRSQGIPVEIAQPGRWQVWAKREVYNTPLLRRVLLTSLQKQGYVIPFLDSQVLKQVPQAAWIVNNTRYSNHPLQITAGKSPIQVKTGGRDPRNRSYAGQLRLQRNAYGNYTLVNQVPLETYLRGVVPHEIGQQAPQPAIEAQAILARTYALRNLRRFQIDNYQLCADTQCQVYEGLTGTYVPADRAIAITQGQVLTYGNQLVDALYFSTSGGITAPFSHVWNGPDRPYLQAVVDAVSPIWDLSRQNLSDEQNFRTFMGKRQGFNEVGWRTFRWQNRSSLMAMNRELKQYLQQNKKPLANLKTIQQVAVAERATSGRVQKLAVTTDLGTIELEKDEIINAFEAPNSLLFYLDPIFGPQKQLQGYLFVGGGLGHGVGLSQVGSYNLGRLGWSYRRILSFYYPGTKIQPVSSALVLGISAASPVPH
jgi:SpoIID/LytB domain protein